MRFGFMRFDNDEVAVMRLLNANGPSGWIDISTLKETLGREGAGFVRRWSWSGGMHSGVISWKAGTKGAVPSAGMARAAPSVGRSGHCSDGRGVILFKDALREAEGDQLWHEDGLQRNPSDGHFWKSHEVDSGRDAACLLNRLVEVAKGFKHLQRSLDEAMVEDLEIKPMREVLILCFGVSIHALCSETFSSIGKQRFRRVMAQSREERSSMDVPDGERVFPCSAELSLSPTGDSDVSSSSEVARLVDDPDSAVDSLIGDLEAAAKDVSLC
ncbi:hypothetical protein Dimus_021151 [Dionaea muscipula]